MYYDQPDYLWSLPDRSLQLPPKLVLWSGRSWRGPGAHRRGPNDRQQLHHTVVWHLAAVNTAMGR